MSDGRGNQDPEAFAELSGDDMNEIAVAFRAVRII